MGGVLVTCKKCHRNFTLAVDASPYLLFDLQSRPCPYCEAYTLSSRAADEEELPARPHPARRHPRIWRGAGDSAPDLT
jgi:hypothetical protein